MQLLLALILHSVKVTYIEQRNRINEMTEFNRTNLMKGYDTKPMYAYEAEGDFRHFFVKLRIVKIKNEWRLKARAADECNFTDYRTGFETKREAIAFVNLNLA